MDKYTFNNQAPKLKQPTEKLSKWIAGVGLCLATVGTHVKAAEITYQAEDHTWSQGVFETINTGFTGSGYVNTDNIAGSYIEFTVNVPSDGNYHLSYRYANGANTHRPIDLSINGEFKLPQLMGAPTGSWQNWSSEPFAINLLAGSNTVRLIGAGAAGAPNIDSLTLVTNNTTQNKYEAENQTWSQAVIETTHKGYSGTGYVNTHNIAGSHIEFTVSVPSAGAYPVAIQYANGSANPRAGDIAINGEFKLPIFNFNSTNSWSQWSSETLSLTLTSGTNKIRIISQNNEGLPNIDSLSVTLSQ